MSRVSFERTFARVPPRSFLEDRDVFVPISAGVDLKRNLNLLIASFAYSCDEATTLGDRTNECGVVRGASDENEVGFCCGNGVVTGGGIVRRIAKMGKVGRPTHFDFKALFLL
jgi:hypothetical protein